MSRRQRLGVLGGTFDPLHMGHLRAAESVRESMGLDKILFVPSRIPPHKSGSDITPSEDRYRMIVAAIDNESDFEVSRIEIDRDGPSYTVDTLRALEESRPHAEIFFITGVDSFREIQTWRRWRDLLESYPFVVHGRPGCGFDDAREAVPEPMRSLLVELPEDAPPPEGKDARVYLLHIVSLNISSTEIRAMLREGRSIRFLVPAEVEEYVREHRLYRKCD